MQSRAKTVAAYLKELPADRRTAIEAVRKVVLANLDPRIEEGMQSGMIGWYIPHSVFPPGYHCDPKQPLPYAGIASQKQYLSLYLMQIYVDGTDDEQWFRKAWAKTGKKLDMGKCCLRFRSADDLALDVIGEAFRRASVTRYLANYAIWDPRNRKQARAKPERATRSAKRSPGPRPKPATRG